ncbi:unnamed protein product [Paramecium octaurelia]|uniref:Uncharacterized protein n=1 Tax=Paramecium octaurelia TaxID=43137 RepID=A0A8S1S6S3_PAROT|nr:unnamed protein product [Paramecium octaurelia]
MFVTNSPKAPAIICEQPYFFDVSQVEKNMNADGKETVIYDKSFKQQIRWLYSFIFIYFGCCFEIINFIIGCLDSGLYCFNRKKDKICNDSC